MKLPGMTLTLRQAVDGWWVQIPLALRYVSGTAAAASVDGQYLAAWPVAGALAPLLGLILGVLIGWRTWSFSDAAIGAITVMALATVLGLFAGNLARITSTSLLIAATVLIVGGLLSMWSGWNFGAVFTESRGAMTLAVLLGVLSGNVGLMFVIGFAFGDFLLADVSWWPDRGWWFHLTHVHVARLVEYAVLAVLAVAQPLIVKRLLAELSLPPRHASRQVRFLFAAVLHLAITLVFVYFWRLSTPVLIRPLFTWLGQNPPAHAIQSLQAEGGGILLIVAVVASIARMGLQGLTAFRNELGSQLDRLDEQLTSAMPVAPFATRLPHSLSIPLLAAAGTLFLAGMIQRWWEAGLLFAVLCLIRGARLGLVRLPLGRWPEVAARIPLLFRLLITLLLVRLVAVPFLESEWQSGSTFRPFVIVTVFAMVVFYLLSPRIAEPVREGGAAT